MAKIIAILNQKGGCAKTTTTIHLGIGLARQGKRVLLDALSDANPYIDAFRLRPAEEWDEDDGTCLWWNIPIAEEPYIGSPLHCDWPGGGYWAFFTKIPNPYFADGRVAH